MNINTPFKTSFIICFLFFIVNSAGLFANDQQPTTMQDCQKLIGDGSLLMKKGNFTKALEAYTKAESLAEKKQWKDRLFEIKFSIGNVYSNLSNYGEAIGFYQQALHFAKEIGKPENIIMVLNNIALLYLGEKDYQNALTYYKKAYALSDKNIEYQTYIAINISDIYNKTGDFKESRKFLMEVKSFPKSERIEQFWTINYAESLILEGRLNESQALMENLEKKVNGKKDTGCYLCVAQLMSKIYSKQNKTELAILFAKKGLRYAQEMHDKADLYESLAQLYFKSKDYTTAFKYKDSVLIAKDSMSVLVNRKLFETNKVKLQVQEYQNELVVNKEKHKAERNIFIISIASTLLIFFFIYRGLKHRIIKQRQEKIIAENQQQIFDLEFEGLKNNIAEKNRNLSAKALYLTGRNELIEEVMNSLSQIPEVAQKTEVANYIKTLRSYLKTDAEWDDFIAYFEKVNPDFIKTLQIKHPLLTAQDLRFICYIYMNLDLKEISTILNITLEACKKRKQRIAKKMDIEPDDLHEYIIKLT
jgi:TPR repeat protein